jgi:hypothetical protein
MEPSANRVVVAVNTMPVDSVNEQVTTSLPLAFRLLMTDPAAALTIVWLVFWPVTVLAMPLPTCLFLLIQVARLITTDRSGCAIHRSQGGYSGEFNKPRQGRSGSGGGNYRAIRNRPRPGRGIHWRYRISSALTRLRW